MYFTNNEIKVLRILWNSRRSLTCREILNENKDTSWAEQTIYNLLTTLISKEAIIVSGYTRCGKSSGRLFEAKLSLEDYITSLLDPIADVMDRRKFVKKIVEISEIDITIVKKIVDEIGQLHN